MSDQRLVWTKKELDDAFKDKRFPDDVKVEFIFEATNAPDHLMHLHSGKIELVIISTTFTLLIKIVLVK